MSQALSLKCNICSVQLKSVAEAQSHGEATGHADFSESTEAVLNLTCQDCGKPCRSQTECDIHTKRTGHATFVDKTTETAKAMDTEGEMKNLKEEMKEELGIGGGAASTSEADEEQVPPVVDEELKAQLEGMGFPPNKIVRALYHTQNESLEAALNWAVEHGDDMDIDEPLLVPKSKAEQKKLTPEEAKRKAEEMVRSAKSKREAEERAADIQREKNRVKMGKEIAAAKRVEEDQSRKRFLMEKEREKREEAAAREKIKAKLEEDRRARRIKLGLPPDPTPEEMEEIRRKEEAKLAEQKEKERLAETNMPPVKPVALMEKLRAVLVEMKKNNEEPEFQTCCKTLMTYCGNIIKDPRGEKFRKIRLGNEAFQKRVGRVPGGLDFLTLLGFEEVEGGEFLEMAEDKVSVPALNAAGGEINSALTNPFFGVL